MCITADMSTFKVEKCFTLGNDSYTTQFTF
jgi:hypothetical protein